MEAVAEALRELNPRYGTDVPVRCCEDGAEADAVREAEPGIDWSVVEMYRPGVDRAKATGDGLWLNTSLVTPDRAARAIEKPDLTAWYEIENPTRVVSVDGGPPADDYSNLTIVVPEDQRQIVHAVPEGGTRPPCVSPDADMVMPTGDLWVLVQARQPDRILCPECTARHP
ncbi:hypothetical protein GCM10009828_097050 [Actinoplanes couchii]